MFHQQRVLEEGQEGSQDERTEQMNVDGVAWTMETPRTDGSRQRADGERERECRYHISSFHVVYSALISQRKFHCEMTI